MSVALSSQSNNHSPQEPYIWHRNLYKDSCPYQTERQCLVTCLYPLRGWDALPNWYSHFLTSGTSQTTQRHLLNIYWWVDGWLEKWLVGWRHREGRREGGRRASVTGSPLHSSRLVAGVLGVITLYCKVCFAEGKVKNCFIIDCPVLCPHFQMEYTRSSLGGHRPPSGGLDSAYSAT